MSGALLFATAATPDGGATALLGDGDRCVAELLAADLAALGVDEVTVVARPAFVDDLAARGLRVVSSADTAADLALVEQVAAGAGSVLLACADVVAHRAALGRIARSGVRSTAAAVQTGPAAAGGAHPQPVLRQRDMVISVGTPVHQVTGPDAVFRGVLGVSAAGSADLRAACAALRGLDADLDAMAGGYGAVGLVLLALVRTGVTVGAYNVRFLDCARVGTAAEAAAAVAALADVDEERGASRAGVKEDDEFLATYLVNSYTPWIVRFFARHGVSPNAVTWISVVIALAAAAGFATGTRVGLVAGAVGFYVSFIFDCCDGQLARFTGRYSRYGGWLDMMADRFKEYTAFAALAVGGVRMHEPGVWGLALAAVTLQTVRHMIDTWYGALQHTATRSLPVVPLDQPLDTLGLRAARRAEAAPVAVHAGAAAEVAGGAARTGDDGTGHGAGGDGDGVRGGVGAVAAVDVEPGGGFGATLGRIAATAHGKYRSPGYWIKRTVVLPIGDRWLLIALAAALFGPRVAFIVLLVAAGLAFGYVFFGRTLRALSMRISVMPHYDIAFQRDDGVLARAIGRLAGGRFPPVPVAVPALLANLAILGAVVSGHPPPAWVVPAAGVLALLAALGAGAPHDRPLDWLTVAALPAMEYTFVLTVVAVGAVPLPLGYALLVALTMYHYDLLGRMEKQATPMAGTRLVRGWELRVALLAVFAAAGGASIGVVVALVAIGGVVMVGPFVGLARGTG